MHDQLIELLILLTSAVVFVPLFRYFNAGAILAYLFAGVVIGPEILTLIKDPKTILHFSELGVVFLLFLIGLELHPARLWRMKRNVFGMGLLQMTVTGGVFLGSLIALNFPLPFAFVAGFGLALSSTAFGLQILEEKHQFQTLHGQGSFSILLFQDLAVVPLLAMIPLLAGIGTSTSIEDVFKTIGIVAGFIFVGIYFIRYFFSFIAQSRTQEVFTATSLLVVIGSAVLMEDAGLSMGTGAFLAGVLLANSEYRHELEINLQPFKGLLLGLFFIAVGMSLKLDILIAKPHIVALVVFGFMLTKGFVIYALARAFGFPHESSRNMACTLPQGGEFAFVLFAAATSTSILDPESSAILNAAVTISMALTPLVFGINQKYMRTFSEVSERPFDKITSESAEVILAGFGRFGQIVSRFLQTQKISFTILEHSAAQVDIARKFGNKIYYGDASREDIVESAGGKTAKIFVLAIDDVETSIKTAKMIKNKFPHLKIIARVRNRNHAIRLLEMGIENVHRETYLTSLEVAKEVLMGLGHLREQINKKLAIFRTHDEALLRQQLKVHGDEKKMISVTNAANAELENILQADEQNHPPTDGQQTEFQIYTDPV